MRSATLFYGTVALIVVIAIANTIALLFGFYWHWSWFDIPMHFLGGLWIACFSTWLARFAGINWQARQWSLGVVTLGSALAIGLVWEAFEIAIGAVYIFGPYPYLPDTTLDLLMDVSGGVLAWALVRHVRDVA
jgi:hypothetical protein